MGSVGTMVKSVIAVDFTPASFAGVGPQGIWGSDEIPSRYAGPESLSRRLPGEGRGLASIDGNKRGTSHKPSPNSKLRTKLDWTEPLSGKGAARGRVVTLNRKAGCVCGIRDASVHQAAIQGSRFASLSLRS